ncbi:conjugal transfer protein TraB [Klebsiella pneumoniae]|uniref:Conjugal transfer protein TraB n=3 Tax=Klebsiella TaxID=570 RepID=A0A7H0EW63_KLEVA|nr:conjugal transfer protein TraB [Klebsiella oxytoca]EIY1427326.1 conjugal transfer protein TraB [Klebsiella pneumoniae]EIY2677883.1 conjugal transfer protein TraB [Raoultella planticola]EJZ0016348.1 conjugal transfer protein TraB [Escherichia coli]EKU0049392.1 conjugal transfer protein TraB [Klebsiella quasipneumoniae]EKU2795189.1 conjugal transfer protein TraB [Klebsiella variicola]EKU2865015.1 conjugal transfer protein TraB [Raoultella ornithinolytica]EKV7899706.1 conjugal transfer prote
MKLKELWAENKAIRMAFLLIVAFGALVMATLTLMGGDDSNQKSKKIKPVTNLLDTSSIHNMDEEGQKRFLQTVQQENRKDQQSMLDQVKQMEKYKSENSSEISELKAQLKQLNQQISDMQNGKGPASNRSLDNRVGQQANDNQQQNPAYQLNGDAVANRNQEIPVAGGISPQRTQLVRTITSNSITTANNGVLEVTPIVEKNITNANQKRVVKAGAPAVAGDGTKPIDSNARHSKRSEDQYLPATSQLYAVLVTGVEAPTSLSSQEEPLGVTFRVKRDVFLPNNYRMDLRDCNLLGTARGDMASERVYIRTTSLSCVNSKGKSFDIKLEAYAVSEIDGKAGIKGTLISRNGNAIMGSALAGGLSALAQGLSPSKVSQLNIDPNSQAQFQGPNIGALGAVSASGMVSGGLNKLTDWYTHIIDQQWPVVELSPGINATFVVLNGASIPTNLAAK